MLLHQCILMGKKIYRCWNYFGFSFCIPLGKYFKELKNEQYDNLNIYVSILQNRRKRRGRVNPWILLYVHEKNAYHLSFNFTNVLLWCNYHCLNFEIALGIWDFLLSNECLYRKSSTPKIFFWSLQVLSNSWIHPNGPYC